MFYKIENKECEVYKRLHELRTSEIQIGKENVKDIEEKTGLTWNEYLGHTGQQNFRRTTQYEGFAFLESEKVDSKTWIKDKKHKDIFVPNKKTKQGREMSSFLLNGLKSSHFRKVFEILNIESGCKFALPFVEIEGELILLFLGDNNEPTDENIIEITKREFEQLRTS